MFVADMLGRLEIELGEYIVLNVAYIAAIVIRWN
jgi:hypothetical protein